MAHASQGEPLRLHIGGEHAAPGWKIVNIDPALPHVDFVGSATDLSAFADATVDEVYGSHIYEHLSYSTELLQAFGEVHRVLKPGGVFKLGVPDLSVLCALFLDPSLTREEQFYVMRMIYGGQTDAFDYHKGGYSFELMGEFMHAAGFRRIQKVDGFNLFPDTSNMTFRGMPISLNMQGVKPRPGEPEHAA
ncbi:MAG: methyltransferase domain-containing protein [Planctomycetota bacterium]|nr:methyltransferase domain-containing protein [Planctomycetota bacterium]